MISGSLWAKRSLALSLSILVCAAPTSFAAQISSTDYTINGNLGGTFGGQGSSTDYTMTAIGGETLVGSGSSTDYIIDQVQPSTAQTMQLSVQPSGLVAYYPLDENSGTTTQDGSVNSNSGTINGTAAWNASGKIGSAVNINGPTDGTGTGSVSIPNNANLPTGSSMSLEAWVNQSAWYQNEAIASVWQSGTSGSWAVQTGTNHNLRIYLATSQTDTGTAYVDTAANSWNNFGSWHHVTVTYDGTQSQANMIHVYIDGVSVGTTVTGTLPSNLLTSTAPLSLGSFPGKGEALSGSLDQIKLFSRALSASDVSAEYTAQNSGTPTGSAFPAITTTSVTSQQDAIVRTNAPDYSVSVQQNHDLQGSSTTIPAISSTIASPASWTEGTTHGLGFTVTGAPVYDSKWGNGTNYAAFPSTATSIYTASGHVSTNVDVIHLSLRLGTSAAQASGSYANTISYTGTILP